MRRSHRMPKRWLVKRRWLVVLARGYHEYKDVEAAATREVLVCRRSLKRVLGTRLYICVLAGKDTNTVTVHGLYLLNDLGAQVHSSKLHHSTDIQPLTQLGSSRLTLLVPSSTTSQH